jgi:3-dehydroquinate dehydratase-1
MREMLADAVANADVGKLAVTATDPADVLTLLMLTREFSAQGEQVATMAMGKPGRHSRAVAPVYGSRIGYAPVDPDEATAPGQYDLATLRQLVEQLRSKPEA